MKKVKPKKILLILLIVCVVGIGGYITARAGAISNLKWLKASNSDRYPKVEAALLESAIWRLKSERIFSDCVTVTYTDYSESNFDYETGQFQEIDIKTPEATELLFDCIRNSRGITNVTGLPLEPEPRLFVVNGRYSGNHQRMYIRYRLTGQLISIAFAEEDAERLFAYLQDSCAELPRESA